MQGVLEGLDWVVIGLYFFVLLVLALWIFFQKNKNTEDYFLAGRNVGWFVIGASIFASNIGSEHIVGLAGTGFETGTPMAHYELHSWIVLLLGWLFLPFYFRSGVYTMPEFLEKRFDSKSRWFLSLFSLIAYVLTKVSVTIYAGGIVVSELIGVPFLVWVNWSSNFHRSLHNYRRDEGSNIYRINASNCSYIGLLTITVLGLEEIGGWNELKSTVIENSPNHFNMWRPSNDPEFPWTGLLFGGTIVGLWYWCTDQYIVQRTLAANNIKIGRRGVIFGAYLKLLPIFIFLIPGIIAFALSIKDPNLFSIDKSDNAFPMLVKTLLPAGLKGLVAGGLMAALMSSLASVFNSCSTIFTIDIYKKLKPKESEANLLRVGKLATTIIVILGILWIPIMQKIGGGVMYQYLQNVQSYIAPPVAAVFLLGIIWKRVNSKAAISTLIVGLFLLFLRLGSEIYFQTEINSNKVVNNWLFVFATVNFSHMAILMFIFSLILCSVISLLSEVPDYNKIIGLTFGTLTEKQKSGRTKTYGNIDIILSAILIVVVIIIFIKFN